MFKSLMSGVLLLSAVTVTAQEASKDTTITVRDYNKGFYVGAQGGLLMGESTLSSFAVDKFHPGWNVGIHGGYRFGSLLSVEATANWGRLTLAEQSCCYDRDYFLGMDWNRYRYFIPEDVTGYYFKDLQSKVFVQRYGLQLNFNVLGLFNTTKDSRWRFEISPAVYAVGTSADVETIADGTPVKTDINKWHFGVGGNAQVSYAVTKNLNVGIYGGFTHLTGKPMDGFHDLHSTNYLIDAGVKLSWAFGKTKKCNAAESQCAQIAQEPMGTQCAQAEESAATQGSTVAKVTAEEPALAEDPASQAASQAPTGASPQAVNASTPQAAASTPQTVDEAADEVKAEVAETIFPTIYFSFNSVWIEPSERAKVKEIVALLNANPSIRVRITGWCDSVGTKEANDRVSLQRAEAVKQALVKRHITSDRIETIGAGICHQAASNAEARYATLMEIIK